MKWHPICLLLAVAAASCSAPPQVIVAPAPPPPPVAPPPPRWQAPLSATVTQIDDYHGEPIADPYRWLEQDGPDTQAWIATQNTVTEAFLAKSGARAALRARLEQVWNFPKASVPLRRGGRTFWRRNDGLQNQAVLCWAATAQAPCRVLLDPNTLASDGTTALQTWAPSPDGRKLAYALAAAGSDWNTIGVRDVDSGRDLADRLEWVKFSGIAWHPDGSGFWYSRYAAPRQGAALTAVNEYQKLYFHRMGTNQSADVLVKDEPSQPKWGFGAETSDDGSFLVVAVSRGAEQKNGLWIQDLRRRGQGGQGRSSGLVEVVRGFGASFDFIGAFAGQLYFRTDHQAPRGRVVGLDWAAWIGAKDRRPFDSQAAQALPAGWREVVVEDADATLTYPLLAGKGAATSLLLGYLKGAAAQLRRAGLDGKPMAAPQLPPLGSLGGLSGQAGDDVVYWSFVDFLQPPRIGEVDLASGATSTWFEAQDQLDPRDYEVAQQFAVSKDGTRVPLFVVHRKGLARDGDAPTYLYGYGGFSVNLTPFYQPALRVWLESGGVVAVAVLRGGAEFGEAWHKAGQLANKQNVFDDFIASAEWLIAQRYTSPRRLAIAGASNGGLLVGACMTQRPELFGAALPAVGVFDMLRFDRFTIGWAWVPEYGASSDPQAFKWLRAYSPLHNVRAGTRYPATLITTADHDDRVVPAHSFKFAAAVQAAHQGAAPVLIRIETKAGHGAGKPTSKQIDEAADRWAFLFNVFDMAAPPVAAPRVEP